MGENKEIRGLLKQDFEHFEADPGIDLWPEIEAELRPKKKRFAIWWTYSAVAASIAILFFCLFWLFNDNPTSQIEKEPGIAKIDTVYKEKPIQNIQDQGEESLAEEKIEIPLEESTPEQETAPQKRVRNTAIYTAKELASDDQKKEENMDTPKPEKAHKNRDINVSQLAMQTMGPGLAPLTEEISRQDAPNIPEQKFTQPAKAEFASYGKKNSIDLNNLSAESVVAFASNGLSKWKKSPIDFYEEKGPDGELKVYQLDFLNLKITKKTRRNATKRL